MSLKEKKLAVFKALEEANTFISLKELLSKLGNDFAERTVRRWLNELVQEGVIQKQGDKRATRYCVVKINKKTKTTEERFGEESQKIIDSVRKPIFERMPVTYNDKWIEEYKPNVTFYFSFESRSQLFEAGKRSKQEDPAGTYAHQIFNRLLIDLSYNSSRLEGNTYSLLDTQKLLLEGTSPEGKLDEEKIMILNHKEAIRYLVDTAPRLQVNTQTIYTLHYLLADGLVEPHLAGKIRDHGVRISGSTYMPFEDPKDLQKRLEIIISKASLIQDPYEQSLFLLIHISYLQAFSDVNKRTARLSANIPLIRSNLVPLSFNDVERDDYNSALIAIYEFQNIKPLLELYIYSYLRTCVMYDSTVKAMGYDIIRVRYRQPRRKVIREIIQKCLVGKEMDDFITSNIPEIVLKEDRDSFIEDLREDLRELDENRMAGLGITMQELIAWKNKQIVL